MELGDIEFVVDQNVYPPSEDTYLLLDALEVREGDSFMEVGCGAGLITVAAARICDRVFATDISFEAVRNTTQNLRRNLLNHKCSVTQTDLLAPFGPIARFSVIAFNPPYLPKDEITTEMDSAFIGGEVGVETTVRFIHEGSRLLELGGRMYVVASSLADLQRVEEEMNSYSLEVREVASSRFFFEKLQILEGTLLKGQTETVL